MAAIGAALALGQGLSAGTGALAGVLLLVGGVLIVLGLCWLVVAGIWRRRDLPANRYRGGSVLAQLAIVILGGNLAAVPILLLLLHGSIERLSDPQVVTVSLFLTPASFLVVLVLFVAIPNALPGLKIWRGPQSILEVLIGGGLGIVVWIASAVVGFLLTWALTQVGIRLGGEQEVAGLAREIPLVWAILAIAICAPIAEELFFRGLAFNAWEREYGTRRAVLGSALLFAIVHVVGGTVLAVVQVFLLGLVLALVYMRGRSLPMTIGLHGVFNLASVLTLFLASGRS